MAVKMTEWRPGSRNQAVDAMLNRPAIDPKAERVAQKGMRDIRRQGDAALERYALRYDGISLRASQFRVRESEFARAETEVSAKHKRALKKAHARIAQFLKAGQRRDWSLPTTKGGKLGEQFRPYDRVGIYVPGGKAPLASTVLMTVTLAKVAGVPEIVVCTPCAADGKINAVLLHALSISGATEVYRIGGIQAIGAMALGTKTIRKVQKIAGPGGPYVTAAKKVVYGDVGLDLVAGPSEICILADGSANARYLAADLISQAEHGTGREKALLVTSSTKVAKAVRIEVEAQTSQRARRAMIRKVIRRGMLIVKVRNLEDGMSLCNSFAAEHLELQVKYPRRWLPKVTCAGAVFVGPWTPESAGDFVAGPSHVLPTGGAAASFSGLTVNDFQRRTSVIAYTKADLKAVAPVIEAFAEIEGLDGHGYSASVRFDDT